MPGENLQTLVEKDPSSPDYNNLLSPPAPTNEENWSELWDCCPAEGKTFEESVLEAGLLDARQIAESYSRHHLLPLFDPPTDQPLPVAPSVGQLLPAKLCCDALIAPLADDGTSLDVAIVSPDALQLRDQIQRLSGRVMRPMFATLQVVEQVLGLLYEDATELRGRANESTDAIHLVAAQDDWTNSATGGSHQSIRVILEDLLRNAVHRRALELHLESFNSTIRCRMRIGGSLVPSKIRQGFEPAKLFQVLHSLSGIKGTEVSSHDAHSLDAYEGSGAIRLRHGRRRLRVDVETCRTATGWKAVLYFRGRELAPRRLTELGLLEDQLQQLHNVLERSSGIVFVVGPPHVGKRTTLYALTNYLNTERRCVYTVEDVVRLAIPGVNQIRLRADQQDSRSNSIQRVLRQNPDVLMVDRIEDPQTAHACFEASRLGALVLAGVDISNAPAAIDQLRRLGVTSDELAAESLLVIEQRLVPRVCSSCCKLIDEPVDPLIGSATSTPSTSDRRNNCTACNGTGYRGQLALFHTSDQDQIRQALQRSQHSLEEPTFENLLQVALHRYHEGLLDATTLQRLQTTL